MKHFSLTAYESKQILSTDSWFIPKNNLATLSKTRKLLILLLMISFFALSCQKEKIENSDLLDRYAGLNDQTVTELRQARNASARYQNLDTALADGYVDIAVNTEHMGHHYMKASLVDSIFDLEMPEILVYNKDLQGKSYLVAIEYAVPLDKPKPEGYTGTDDVWDGNLGFQLWLLHAWVWAYNPEGVFHSTNPLVHLH